MPGVGHVWTLSDGYTLGDALYLGQIVGASASVAPETGGGERIGIRRPAISAFIELQGDVTANIKNFQFTRRIEDSLHEPGHGSGTLTLKDTEGQFIQNGRCTIRPNDKVMIFAGFGVHGRLYSEGLPRFTGIVKEPAINAETGEIGLNLQDFGWPMKNKQTSGDWSDYNTPKLLVDELLSRLNLGEPVWENETGLPSTFALDTDSLSRRNYWKLVHGALLGIGYVAYFDGQGKLQCRRRDSFSDGETILKDRDLISLRHHQVAEVINEKSVDLNEAAPVPWAGFTVGDHVRWGQATYTAKDETAQVLHSVLSDYEAEEMITSWPGILAFARDSVKRFKYPRHIYEARIPARPYLNMLDRIRVVSKRRGISLQAVIIGISEYGSGLSYTQTLSLLTERELF